MIPTMPPVSAMPSSTRLTPTFTPPNTKSIAPQSAPALQQRQGFDRETLNYFKKIFLRRKKAANNSPRAIAERIKNEVYYRYTPVLTYIIKCLSSEEWAKMSLSERKADYAEQLVVWANGTCERNPYFEGNPKAKTGITNALTRHHNKTRKGPALSEVEKRQLLVDFGDFLEEVTRYGFSPFES